MVPHPLVVQLNRSLLADPNVQSNCTAALDTLDVLVKLVEEGGGDADVLAMKEDSKGGDVAYFLVAVREEEEALSNFSDNASHSFLLFLSVSVFIVVVIRNLVGNVLDMSPGQGHVFKS